ncbi:DUF3492 domain-containing protein [Streptacidiphilus cavernicola]|uniref:D-inositol 3-phosphate glycosyltransferase n=1 Tax=Streptacidiphilus cavernicola TaxID=3342716 RepID=A0ABV6VUK9_9ACTN
MRIALLTEGGFPIAESAEGGWCDRLTRGLPEHEFEMYALGAARREAPPEPLPARLSALRPSTPAAAVLHGRPRRRALLAYRALVRSLVEPGAAAGFGPALYALAEAGRGGGLPALLRSGAALRVLETAWQAPGAIGAAGSGAAVEPQVRDVLVAADLLAHHLRALSAPWYGAEPAAEGPVRERWWSAVRLPGQAAGPAGLASADICHAVGGGPAVLPGLLAKHFYGIPLIITEHGLHLRERARGYRDAPYRRPVRALLLTFFRLLAREGYRQAGLITPGSSYDQRWQIHCGADPATVRVVYEGTENADRPAAGAEPEIPTLVWTGPIEPHGGLETALRGLAELRETHATARLRVHGGAPAGAEAYRAHCAELVATLFPDEAEAVVFEEAGARLDAVYERGTVTVLSGTRGAPPRLLAEAMLSGRPVVATDVGAARELIGPTGLLVPAEDPRALAAACAALLADEERRARLGNAGRLRAQEMYAVEPAATAFRGLYLELVSGRPLPVAPLGAVAARRPFGRTAEAWVAASAAQPQPVAMAAGGGVAAKGERTAEGGPAGVGAAGQASVGLAEAERAASGWRLSTRLAELRVSAPRRERVRTAVPVGALVEEAGAG